MEQPPYERNLVCLKVGTNSILKENGFNHLLLEKIGKLQNKLNSSDLETDLVIVTSGSIGAGLLDLGIDRSERPPKDDREMLSAISSVGQPYLMSQYQMAIRDHKVGQVLVEQRNFEDADTSHHIGQTIRKLLELNVVPIINENDAVNDGAIAKEDNSAARDRENDFIALGVTSLLKRELNIGAWQMMSVKATTTQGLLRDVSKPRSTIRRIDSAEQVNGFLMKSVDNSSTEPGTSGGQKGEVLNGYLDLGIPYWIMHHNDLDLIPVLVPKQKKKYFGSPQNATLVLSTEQESSV